MANAQPIETPVDTELLISLSFLKLSGAGNVPCGLCFGLPKDFSPSASHRIQRHQIATTRPYLPVGLLFVSESIKP